MKEQTVITKTKFTCDNLCGIYIEEQHQFPYEKGWRYLYNIEAKLSAKNLFIAKDKHFCSFKCISEYIIKSLMRVEGLNLSQKEEKKNGD